MLRKDHDAVDRMFKDYEELVDANSSREDRRLMSTRICGMLAVHAMIEEEIFYPAARAARVESDLLDEAEIEHGSMKELIAHIGEASATQALYDARVKVLGEVRTAPRKGGGARALPGLQEGRDGARRASASACASGGTR
jgi:hypothetical protein